MAHNTSRRIEERQPVAQVPHVGHTNVNTQGRSPEVSLHARSAKESRTSICRWRKDTRAPVRSHAAILCARWDPARCRSMPNRNTEVARARRGIAAGGMNILDIWSSSVAREYSTSPRIRIHSKSQCDCCRSNLEERAVTHERQAQSGWPSRGKDCI